MQVSNRPTAQHTPRPESMHALNLDAHVQTPSRSQWRIQKQILMVLLPVFIGTQEKEEQMIIEIIVKKRRGRKGEEDQ